MYHIQRGDDLRSLTRARRDDGQRIALVPTMGNIHDGHLTLVKQARQLADLVVVSLFVNPTQFDRQDDYLRYPRTLAEDQQRLLASGVDVLFCPTVETMYPNGLTMLSYVEVTGVSEILEGEKRPGHFRGVATVVNKLFNLVQPDVAVFGEKDWQQLVVIRAMVAELCMPVSIVGVPVVRERDGLAMSSRNIHLTPEQRVSAAQLYAVLREAKTRIETGAGNYAALESAYTQRLEEAGFRVDYFAVRRIDLDAPGADDRDLVVLLAAWLGNTRLIDNLPVTIKN